MSAELIDLITQLAVVLFVMVINGLLLMATLSIAASDKRKLASQAQQGRKGADMALNLLSDIDLVRRKMGEIILLLAMMNGIIAGAVLIDEFQKIMRRVPFWLIRSNSKDSAVLVLLLIIPFLTVLLNLLIPKKLASLAPEAIASFFSYPIAKLLEQREQVKKIAMFFSRPGG